jgi:hypothetical protein
MADTTPVEPRWDSTHDEGWTQQVDAPPWQARPDAEDDIKSLSCPRCKHQMTVTYEGGLSLFRKRAPAEPEVSAFCNCSMPHADTPVGMAGCGRNGWIRSPDQWSDHA